MRLIFIAVSKLKKKQRQLNIWHQTKLDESDCQMPSHWSPICSVLTMLSNKNQNYGPNCDSLAWMLCLQMYQSQCGWMFLLVPAHPGCPGQIPQSRKMVVCVWVYQSQCVCKLVCTHAHTVILWPSWILSQLPGSARTRKLKPGR